MATPDMTNYNYITAAVMSYYASRRDCVLDFFSKSLKQLLSGYIGYMFCTYDPK
jgi:hypothetical protein